MSGILTQSKVLVLNRSWNPISIVNLERALSMLMGGEAYDDFDPKARIMDPTRDFKLFTWKDWEKLVPADDEKVIRGGTRRDGHPGIYRVPEIVLTSHYNKLPQQRVHFSRRTIYRRDNNQCQYCGRKPGTPELNIDHVIPRSRGGLTTWENCVLSCVVCNKRKADRTPEEAGMTLLRQPKKPRYTLLKSDYRCKSWESILGAAYWLTELENDNG